MQRRDILIPVLAALLLLAGQSAAYAYLEKKHDFLPRHQNVFFVVDISPSMNGDCAGSSRSRLSVALEALRQFNTVIPATPLWQYPLLTSLVTIGDPIGPGLLVPLQVSTPGLFDPYYNILLATKPHRPRFSHLGEALQFCASMSAGFPGRTAVILFTDGGTGGQLAQQTAVELKQALGDTISVFGVFVGSTEIGWRNIFEVCKLTGGYVRTWQEVLEKNAMRDFVWDILVQEVSFHYIEVFFQENSADLLPSEAGKLENVANFLRMIPPYVLTIDGYSIPGLEAPRSRRIALQRAEVVKKALVQTYKVSPNRILVQSIGSAYPRYRYDDPEANVRNAEAVVYLRLPLRGSPYDEKKLHTFGQSVSGIVLNGQERFADDEWAWPLSYGSARGSHKGSSGYEW